MKGLFLKPKKDSSKHLEVISRIEPEPVPVEGAGEEIASAVAPAKRRKFKSAPWELAALVVPAVCL